MGAFDLSLRFFCFLRKTDIEKKFAGMRECAAFHDVVGYKR